MRDIGRSELSPQAPHVERLSHHGAQARYALGPLQHCRKIRINGDKEDLNLRAAPPVAQQQIRLYGLSADIAQ